MAINVKIIADASQLRAALKRSERALGRYRKSKVWNRIRKRAAYTFAAVGLSIAGATKAITDLTTSFDEAYSSIKKATGATGKEWEAARRTFLNTLGKVPQDMEQVAAVFGTAMTMFSDAADKELAAITKHVLDL